MTTLLRPLSTPLVLAVSLLVLSAPSLLAQPAIGTAPAIAAKVSQLDFIAGPWTGTLGDRTIEQHWSAPLGNSMVAMYRNVQDGEVRLYELLVMEQEGEGIALRIKHFAPGAGLVGRQEKDVSVDHRLVALKQQSAVFEGTGPNPTRVTFTRTSPQALVIRVERMRDGALTGTDFNYRRLE